MDPTIAMSVIVLAAEITRLIGRAQQGTPLTDEERAQIVARTMSFVDRQPPV